MPPSPHALDRNVYYGENTESSVVLHGIDQANDKILQFVSNAIESIDACLDATGLSVMMGVASIKEERFNARRRGVKFRYITEITNGNLPYCKELMKISELRHLDGVKGNFEVNDQKEYVCTATLEQAEATRQLIYSNVKEVVEQQQYVFDTLWKIAIPAQDRIMEIEKGIKPETVEIIRNSNETVKLEFRLIDSARDEILIILSSANMFHLQRELGIVQLLMSVGERDGSIINHNGNSNRIRIRILAPRDDTIEQSLEDLRRLENFDVRYIPANSGIKTETVIVDRKDSLVMELKEPQEVTIFDKSIGLSTYCNSKSTVSSYVSIFESLWNQTELYDKLKNHDMLQQEFINLAAHELRTPTQSILGYIELAKMDSDYNKIDAQKGGFIDTLYRNAIRLQRLTNDILDVTRLESNTLKLDKERFDLKEKIQNVIKDSASQFVDKNNVMISFIEPKNPIFVEADKTRMYQVISNLLTNAIKFTSKGTIIITAASTNSGVIENGMKKGNKDINDKREVIVSVKDTGTGIDPNMKSRLFSKFASLSESGGFGLGLYLSKRIIEAHHGKIWAENNKGSSGATFSFSLPILS